MGDVKKALHYQREAERKRALAPSNDPVRFEFDQKWADALEEDAQALLNPDIPLEMGSGGEIIPPPSMDATGLEVILRKPDLLNLGATQVQHLLLGFSPQIQQKLLKNQRVNKF